MRLKVGDAAEVSKTTADEDVHDIAGPQLRSESAFGALTVAAAAVGVALGL